MMMYGRQPKHSDLLNPTAFNAQSYPAYLQDKLANLQDFVESNLAAAADQQKSSYDAHSSLRNFNIGDHVCLSVPTAGKLDPQWKGNWTIKSIKSPVNVEITDGQQSRVVHIDHVRRCVQTAPQELQNNNVK